MLCQADWNGLTQQVINYIDVKLLYLLAEGEADTNVAGIPDFWLHVLQSHKGWSEEVSSMLACPTSTCLYAGAIMST